MNIFEMFGTVALKGGETVERQLDGIDNKGKQASKAVDRLGDVSEKAGKLMKRAFLVSLAGATALTAGIVKLLGEAGSMETISVAYEVLIGNAEKAKTTIADLKDFSASTPLSFTDITKAGKTLMAFGASAESLRGKISMLGDMAMGNAQKLESLTRAYGKVQAKGRASMEEINIITESGVPILEALSNQYDVTVEELMKLVSAGKVGFEDLNSAMQSLTGEGGQFFGMLEKQSQTFAGMMSTMKDNISILMSELGARLLPKIKPLIGAVTRAFGGMVDDLTSETGGITVLSNVLEKLVGGFVNIAETSMKVGATVPVIWRFLAGSIGVIADNIKTRLKGPTDAIVGFAEGLIGWIGSSGVKDAVATAWKITIVKVGEAWDFITGVALPWLGSAVTTAWNWTVQTIKGIIPEVKSAVSTFWGWTIKVIEGAIPVVQRAVSTAWDWTVKIVSGAIPLVRELVTTSWNWTVKIVEGAIPVIRDSFTTVWKWTVQIASDAIPVVMPIVETIWNWSVRITGDAYDALIKGFSEGDWSHLFGVSKEVFEKGISIFATISTAKILAGALFASIGRVLTGAGVGFLSIGTAGIVAGVSVAVQIADAIVNPENGFAGLASNLLTALIAGLGVGLLTWNPALGAYAFTIAVNLKLGEVLFGKELSKDQLADYTDTATTTLKDASEEEVQIIEGIWKSWEGLFSKYKNAKDKLIAIYQGTEIGRAILDGMEIGLDEIGDLGIREARQLLDVFADTLGIHSPSVKFMEMAMNVIQGFMNGLEGKFPELSAMATGMMDELSAIWKEQEEEAGEGAEDTFEAMEDAGRKSKVLQFFKELAKGATSELEKVWSFTTGLWDAISEFEWTWGNVWNGIKDIATNALFALDGAVYSVLESVKKLPKAFMEVSFDSIAGLLGNIFNASSLGGAIEGFKQGFEKYRKEDEDGNPVPGITGQMLTGGVAGMAMGLAMESPQFQKLLEKLEPILGKVVDLFGKLIAPLMPLVTLLGQQLEPLLVMLQPLIEVAGEMIFKMVLMLMRFIPPLIKILEPILKLIVWTMETIIMPALELLYKAVSFIYNGIARAINGLISALNSIPFVNIKWRLPLMDSELPTSEQLSEEVGEEEGETSGSGGRTISEITGPTRDLLINLLSPLSSLNGLTGVANRIYDLLNERLIPGGRAVVIDNITINSAGNLLNARDIAEELEEILGERIAFATGA